VSDKAHALAKFFNMVNPAGNDVSILANNLANFSFEFDEGDVERAFDEGKEGVADGQSMVEPSMEDFLHDFVDNIEWHNKDYDLSQEFSTYVPISPTF
jgi:hypothetical protein